MTAGNARRWPARPTRRLAMLAWPAGAALFLANLATLLSVLGARWWLFELVTHFTVQLAAVQVFGVLVFAPRRSWRPVLLTLPFLLVNLLPIGRYHLPSTVEAAAGDRTMLRVMTLNLNIGNDRADLVERVVDETDPDVILLLEASDPWRRRLAGLSARYPHAAGRSIGTPFSILLLSRLSLRDIRILGLPFGDRPSITATLCPAGGVSDHRCLTLLGTHLAPPVTPELADERNLQLRAAGEWARSQPSDRIILLGDLNVTPWSPVFEDLLETAALRDSALGFGYHTTWLSRFPLFGLSIDHILVGPGVAVLDRHVGPDVGSDHFPVIADLAF